jgi:hypothetical protein
MAAHPDQPGVPQLAFALPAFKIVDRGEYLFNYFQHVLTRYVLSS